MPPKDKRQRLFHERQIERNIENERLRKLTAKLQVKIHQQQGQALLTRAS
jgi:hypothetical protein